MMDKPDKKFELIREIISKEENVLSITELCRIAGVSRSGYYRWVNAEDMRQARERRDQEDFSLILQAYQFRGYAKGIRGIHMRLLHLPERVVMNVKRSNGSCVSTACTAPSDKQISTAGWRRRSAPTQWRTICSTENLNSMVRTKSC